MVVPDLLDMGVARAGERGWVRVGGEEGREERGGGRGGERKDESG